MKKPLFFFLLFLPSIILSQTVNNFTVDLARAFSRDIFELNGLNFLQPVVKVVNSTSNVGFYYDAKIPFQVKKPYFKFTIQTMYGITPESEKSYIPKMPTRQFNPDDIQEFIKIDLNGLKIDTAGLVHYLFLNMMYDGVYGNNKGLIIVPQSASTALGNKSTAFELRKSALDTLLKAHPMYEYLKNLGLASTLENAIQSFPDNFILAQGGNINHIFAGVPQLVIGSLYGTELLVRYIPEINLGSMIGDFGFWGLGINHNLTNYLFSHLPGKSPFDGTLQLIYQSTQLENTVGVTNAKLKAEAEMLNFNLHLSKNLGNYFNVYAGASYEKINIQTSYKYALPIEVQWQLKLLEWPHYSPTPGYPGDQNPQTALVKLHDSQFKFTIGLSAEFYNFILASDFNFSKVNIWGATIGYKF